MRLDVFIRRLATLDCGLRDPILQAPVLAGIHGQTRRAKSIIPCFHIPAGTRQSRAHETPKLPGAAFRWVTPTETDIGRDVRGVLQVMSQRRNGILRG